VRKEEEAARSSVIGGAGERTGGVSRVGDRATGPKPPLPLPLLVVFLAVAGSMGAGDVKEP
jgi:hypothetical protein